MERFFRSLKEKCTWLPNFQSFDEARTVIAHWIRFYNEQRPHPSLGHPGPTHTGLDDATKWLDLEGALPLVQRSKVGLTFLR